MYQSSRVSGQQEEQTVAPKAAPVSPQATPAPGEIRVMKRNGAVVGFDATKIVVAMSKAFLAVEGNTAAASNRIHETVERLTAQVVDTFRRRMPSGGIVHIEDIQDQVELCLMRNGEHRVARDYVLYREERKRMRSEKIETPREDHPEIKIVKEDGTREPLDVGRLKTVIAEACEGLGDVDGSIVLSETLKNLYDGVTQHDVNTALIMSARTLVEKEPNYTYVTAR
ncbi:MAG: ATP cone domain-containing protein, partial [Litorivicinaceae bacterium]